MTTPSTDTQRHTPTSPRHVLLFSGHRVDAPGRAPPRFPATQVAAAQAAIERALDTLNADARDLALTQGASGGDLLFAQACVERGVRVQLLLPVSEADFIANSVLGSDGPHDWRARFAALRAELSEPPRVLSDAPDAAPGGEIVYERCNRWLLDTALAYGVDRLRFICLWDGAPGDSPGGTGDMVRAVWRVTRQVSWIDTRRLGKTGATGDAGAP